MKTLRDYCQERRWCRELLFAAVLFGIAATGALIVLRVVPMAPLGD